MNCDGSPNLAWTQQDLYIPADSFFRKSLTTQTTTQPLKKTFYLKLYPKITLHIRTFTLDGRLLCSTNNNKVKKRRRLLQASRVLLLLCKTDRVNLQRLTKYYYLYFLSCHHNLAIAFIGGRAVVTVYSTVVL